MTVWWFVVGTHSSHTHGLSWSLSLSLFLSIWLYWIGLVGFNSIVVPSVPAKISYATTAVEQGVESAVILDGRVPHALLKQVVWSSTTKNTGGTVITSSSSSSKDDKDKKDEE